MQAQRLFADEVEVQGRAGCLKAVSLHEINPRFPQDWEHRHLFHHAGNDSDALGIEFLHRGSQLFALVGFTADILQMTCGQLHHIRLDQWQVAIGLLGAAKMRDTKANAKLLQLFAKVLQVVLGNKHIDFTDLKYELFRGDGRLLQPTFEPGQEIRADQGIKRKINEKLQISSAL